MTFLYYNFEFFFREVRFFRVVVGDDEIVLMASLQLIYYHLMGERGKKFFEKMVVGQSSKGNFFCFFFLLEISHCFRWIYLKFWLI